MLTVWLSASQHTGMARETLTLHNFRKRSIHSGNRGSVKHTELTEQQKHTRSVAGHRAPPPAGLWWANTEYFLWKSKVLFWPELFLFFFERPQTFNFGKLYQTRAIHAGSRGLVKDTELIEQEKHPMKGGGEYGSCVATHRGSPSRLRRLVPTF